MKFKEGDKIRCNQHDCKDLTFGQTYTVLEITYSGLVTIRDDAETWNWFPDYFDLVSSSHPTADEQITLAKSYIGRQCISRSGIKFTPTQVKVFVLPDDVIHSSFVVQNAFKECGFAVALSDGTYVIPVTHIKETPTHITLRLTDDYEAIIYKDKVEVGCQTIPKEVIEELYKNLQSLQ